MQRKEAATDRSDQIARIAWLVTFVVPLILAALLLTVKSAQAEPPATPVALDYEEVFEAEIEEVSELEPEEACIEAEESFEVEELAEAEMEEICEEEQSERGPKSEASAGAAAEECALRSANAHATTKNDKLRLTIGYTTTAPNNAIFEVKLGATKLATFQRQLGKSGVIRFTKQLDEGQHGKLKVRLKLSSGSAGCPSQRLVLFPR